MLVSYQESKVTYGHSRRDEAVSVDPKRLLHWFRKLLLKRMSGKDGKKPQQKPEDKGKQTFPNPGRRDVRPSVELSHKQVSVINGTFGPARTAGSDHVVQTWKSILEDDTNYFDDM
jgi:hypothetical protein